MSIRSTMYELIRVIRGITASGTADYTINSYSYWSDSHLQTVLDRWRVDIYREGLQAIDSYAGGGTVQYLYYQSEYGNYEQTQGGSEIFWLEDGDGDKIGSASYSVDYGRGLITFAANTLGTAYYLTGRSYDLNKAAADIWRQKAAHYASLFSFSTDNHRIDKGALITNALKMAALYDARSGPVVTTLYRSDIDVTALD